jgi:hypothetical protein
VVRTLAGINGGLHLASLLRRPLTSLAIFAAAEVCGAGQENSQDWGRKLGRECGELADVMEKNMRLLLFPTLNCRGILSFRTRRNSIPTGQFCGSEDLWSGFCMEGNSLHRVLGSCMVLSARLDSKIHDAIAQAA